MPTKVEQSDLLQVALRPQRRVADPGRRPGDARRVLHARDRGRAHRAQVHDPGRVPVRRVRRQRRRAVAGARRSTACRTSRSTNATARRGHLPARTRATPRPSPGRGPSPAPPGLEHRIGGLEKADGLGNVSYDPENHHKMTLLRAAEGRRDRAATSRRSTSFGPDAGDLLILGWGSHLRRDPERRRAPAARPASPSPTRTCATSTRSRPTRATCCRATGRCSSRRSTSASCRCCCGPRTSSTPSSYNRVRASRSGSRRSSTRPSASSASGAGA